MASVDKENAIPYYLQLAEILREKISSGEYQPDELIPSEREFCDSYEVSRSTVRQTMQLLKEEGLIRKQRGVGTRVSVPSKIEQNLSGFHDLDTQLLEQGLDATTAILRDKTLQGPSKAHHVLALAEDEWIFQVERLRIVAGDPICIEKIYMPRRVFPRLQAEDFVGTDIFTGKMRDEYGVVLGQMRVYLEPVILSEEEADILAVVERPAPALLIERVTHDDRGEPVALTKRLFRGDRCRHSLELKTR